MKELTYATDTISTGTSSRLGATPRRTFCFSVTGAISVGSGTGIIGKSKVQADLSYKLMMASLMLAYVTTWNNPTKMKIVNYDPVKCEIYLFVRKTFGKAYGISQLCLLNLRQFGRGISEERNKKMESRNLSSYLSEKNCSHKLVLIQKAIFYLSLPLRVPKWDCHDSFENFVKLPKMGGASLSIKDFPICRPGNGNCYGSIPSNVSRRKLICLRHYLQSNEDAWKQVDLDIGWRMAPNTVTSCNIF